MGVACWHARESLCYRICGAKRDPALKHGSRARANAGCSSVTSSANGRAVLNRATVPSVGFLVDGHDVFSCLGVTAFRYLKGCMSEEISVIMIRVVGDGRFLGSEYVPWFFLRFQI